MPANFTFNPFKASVAQGMFNTSANGLRQGTAYGDPATRNRLRGGILNANEALPLWGGIGIYMNVPGVAGDPSPTFGPVMGRASSLTGIKALAGFSVFDQNYAAVNSPQSTVPYVGTGGQVNAYPLGSFARVAVQCDPTLASLMGGPVGAQVSWDFVNQILVPFNAAPLTITSGTYDPVTGITTLTMSAPINFGPADAIIVSALTGTGAFASLNGTWTAVAPTSGSTVTFIGPAALAATTITGGSLVLGSGANSVLPVKVLEVQVGNCITVAFDPVTTYATWNFNGTCAVIQL